MWFQAIENEIERTSKKAIQLHQKLKVDIVTLGRLAMAVPNMVTIEVDTCERNSRLAKSSCAVCVLALDATTGNSSTGFRAEQNLLHLPMIAVVREC